MDNHAPFLELVSHLRKLLELEGYSDSTIKDMSFILDAFTTYMAENALKEYTPEIGEYLVKYCEQDLHVCESRVVRARRIVRQLNRLSLGLDGRDALWSSRANPIELPSQLGELLSRYIAWCKSNGNNENTLLHKRWICCRFLKNLADLGCETAGDLSDEMVQTAFLRLGYARYWEKISPFLRFLYMEGLIPYNYANLLHYRKKNTPHPTVYSPEEVAVVEDSVSRENPAGVRNYAIILLLSRYGIRSRDVAALTFENLDFRNNRIRFTQQKTGDIWEGKLFPEVKSALQDYISNARPEIEGCNNVFLTAMIPYIPLDSFAINTMVGETFKRADLALLDRRHGSRAFRSSIASNMINDSISTEIIRKVLGHGTQYALKYYAKIDIESMRLCPLPVPAPSGIFAELLSWKVGEGHV